MRQPKDVEEVVCAVGGGKKTTTKQVNCTAPRQVSSEFASKWETSNIYSPSCGGAHVFSLETRIRKKHMHIMQSCCEMAWYVLDSSLPRQVVNFLLLKVQRVFKLVGTKTNTQTQGGRNLFCFQR